MIRDILFRSTIGIALEALHIESTVDEVWANMLAGFLSGIYFGLSSLIWESESWSNLKKQ